jgi:AP-2 complex subunit mu-1
MADNFRTQILNNKEASSVQSPIRTLGSVTFMYLKHSDVYMLMCTRNNANAMLAFKFMSSVSLLMPPGGAAAAGRGGAPQ